MTALRIAGVLIVALSSFVLWLTLRGAWSAQASFRAHGEPALLDSKSRLIIFGWLVAFVGGVALIALSYA